LGGGELWLFAVVLFELFDVLFVGGEVWLFVGLVALLPEGEV
jgi:hypothetical protein